MMRKIIVSEFITLDGVMEGPGKADGFTCAGWTEEYGNADILKYKHHELTHASALLLGRVTYEGFASVWPTIEGAGEFGEKMNDIPKYVVSTTLENLDWNNSVLIKDDIEKNIKKLQAQDGGDILVFGSSGLVHTLMNLNLVDEYRLLTYPVVLGTGKKLFRPNDIKRLKLIESKQFGEVVLLRYSPEKTEEKEVNGSFY